MKALVSKAANRESCNVYSDIQKYFWSAENSPDRNTMDVKEMLIGLTNRLIVVLLVIKLTLVVFINKLEIIQQTLGHWERPLNKIVFKK